MNKSSLSLDPAKILKILLITVSVFISAHIFLQIMSQISDKYVFRMLTPWFDLDEERNLPTLLSTFLLFCCSVLLYLISILDRKINTVNRYYWALLSVIFLVLSTDETLSFHERLINPVTELIGQKNIPGIFHFAWVIPALIVMVLFGLYFRRFYFSLNKRTKINFLIAFLLYAGGALGMEMVGSQFSSLNGEDNFIYKLLTTIEETLELTGTVFFIYALIVYMSDFFVNIEFNIKGTGK